MKKIFFIYGFGGHKGQARIAKKVLNNYELICFEYNSKLEQSLRKIVLDLDNFINFKTSEKEKVNLVGISTGGIIATYYAGFVSPKKVHKLATICSPFKGTYVTSFYSKRRKGLKELNRNSAFLKKLNSKKLGKDKTINFYSVLDLLVPGKSGKGENPFHTSNFFHFTIQNDKRIFKKIKEFFDKK